jgi:hypothetical protein
MAEKTVGSGRTLTPLERQQQTEARLGRYEQALQALDEAFQRTSAQQRGAFQNIVEVLNAVIRLQGEGFEQRVEDEVVAARTRRAQEQLNKAKSVLQQLIDDKVLVAAETITPDSIIVGKELDAQGNLVGLGEAQAEFSQFTEDARAAFLGQGVGTKYTGPDGQFEVTAIYKPNPDLEKTPETAPAVVA